MKIQDFDTYQKESLKTAKIVKMDHPLVYPTMGLVNEAGEVAEANLTKLFSRLERGKIKGDGDER